MVDTITITKPDDWHVHVRDGEIMKLVAPMTAMQFGRTLVMPNLVPPVITVNQALGYRDRILNCVTDYPGFDPKMSLYLTDDTPVEEVAKAANNEHILGFKLYPAGATTNSSSGVTRVSKVMPVLEAMSKHGVALQVHGEVTDSHVDVFDREAVFIDQIMIPLHRELPELKMVLEHVTTSQGIEFVQGTNHNVAATVTPQHLLYSRNELFRGGIRPHAYCLPVLKRETHRQSILSAVTSGDPSFFLGTDSAPHTRDTKESNCGCAGIFSAYSAIELYTGIFDEMDALPLFEGFASHYGADFYGLARNADSITLNKSTWDIPEFVGLNSTPIVPLKAGESISWKLAS